MRSAPPMLLVPDPGFPSVRQAGSRARGLTYEHRVRVWLVRECARRGWTLLDHPWMASPWGVCQPDFIVERVPPFGRGGTVCVTPASVPGVCVEPALPPLIVEAKLTWVDCALQAHKYKTAVSTATEGRAGLSLPSGAFAQDPLFVQVCRRLTPQAPDPIESLDDAYDGAVILLWV
jgi:hypothetical protein